MVIQSTMSPSEILQIWPRSKSVLERYGISPTSQRMIAEEVPEEKVPHLLRDLNEAVGSTATTCTAGG